MKKITKEDVLDWHGQDHTKGELAQIVAEIANGEYSTEELKRDIRSNKE